MNLRDEMVSRFNGTIGKVLWMTERYFFEKYPDEKARYKSFKKDVETYKYASDEEIFTHKDKSGKSVKIERRDALLIALLKDHSWLSEKVKDAARAKDREITNARAKAELDKTLKRNQRLHNKTVENLDALLASGEIDQARYDEEVALSERRLSGLY